MFRLVSVSGLVLVLARAWVLEPAAQWKPQWCHLLTGVTATNLPYAACAHAVLPAGRQSSNSTPSQDLSGRMIKVSMCVCVCVM